MSSKSKACRLSRLPKTHVRWRAYGSPFQRVHTDASYQREERDTSPLSLIFLLCYKWLHGSPSSPFCPCQRFGHVSTISVSCFKAFFFECVDVWWSPADQDTASIEQRGRRAFAPLISVQVCRARHSSCERDTGTLSACNPLWAASRGSAAALSSFRRACTHAPRCMNFQS